MVEMEKTTEKEGVSVDVYLEQDKQIENLTSEIAAERLRAFSRVEGYREEVYEMFIKYLQKIEQEKGLKECAAVVLAVLKSEPSTKIEYALINSVLEVVIFRTKKYEDKWRAQGEVREEAKKEEEKTDRAEAAQIEKTASLPEISPEPSKQPVQMIRPGLFSMKKLLRLRNELRAKTEKTERQAEKEENGEEEAERYLNSFFETITPAFITYLVEISRVQNCERLFVGEWEGLVDANLQIDFLVLFFTMMEMYVAFSVIFKRAVQERDLVEKTVKVQYKELLVLHASFQSEEVDRELLICLNLAMEICILLKGSALQDCFALFSQEGKNILTEKNIATLQRTALKSLGLLYYKEKNEALVDMVYSFFTTGCLGAFSPQERRSIIEDAVEAVMKALEQKKLLRLIRKIMYAYESSAQYLESTAQMISIFLSRMKTKDKASTLEINGFFTRIIARSPVKIEHIPMYCSFLAMHDIDLPIHHLIRGYDSQFIATFYMTYFRHPFTLEKGTKAVGDFINFVCVSENLSFIYIMNMVPFIPSSPFIVHKLFLIYKRMYGHPDMFPPERGGDMLLMKMKTPALVGVADYVFSDPRPIIKKRILRTLADQVKVSSSLSEDYIAFLTIVHTTEKAKLENYNYKGVISYLKDDVTLKYMGQHLPEVLEMVHRSLEIDSKDFYKTYACDLLKIAADSKTYPLSLRIIANILYILFQKENSISLSEELHIRFRECFDTFRNQELPMYDLGEILRKYTDLYDIILKKMREEVTEAYNYIVLNIVDLGLFYTLPAIRDGRGIKELVARSNLIMKIIREFPTVPMQGVEIWEWIYGICVRKGMQGKGGAAVVAANPSEALKYSLSSEEYTRLLYMISTGWVSDLIVIRGETPRVIDNTRNYLRWILSEEYSLETLLILLKVSTREEKRTLLKLAVLKGYNTNEEPASYVELFKLAKGSFYEYPVSQTHNFLCALHWMPSSKFLKTRELKEQELYEMSIEELVFLSTEYNIKKVADVLMKKRIVRCCGFFVNVGEMSVLDALSVIANSEDEQEILMALDRLRVEENRDGAKSGGDGLMFYVPQMVQLLKKPFRKNGDEIKQELIGIVKDKTAHTLIWEIRAQGDRSLEKYETMVLETMGADAKEQYNKMSVFLRSFVRISEKLKKHVGEDRDRKKVLINKEISQVTFPEGCYLPVTGESVVAVMEGSGRALQSAEKVPYMVTFKVKHKKTGEVVDRAVIFKSGDDCRQDVLALQIIKLFQEIFKEKGLPIFLYPYKVLATGNGSGIIEVIPKAISRDQMGRERVNNLVDYFSLKYGYKEGQKYMYALKNFVESFAGYSLVTYILNIKDRHNGNIMITDEGHVIHIDFGFIFDIYPGNINIESPIKITDEIFSLLGGSEGAAFKMYRDLMIQGFYALRKRSKEIMMLADLGRYAGLSCYTPATLRNMAARFRLDLKDEQVPEFVRHLIISSTKKLRTWIYDQYQHLTNNIAF